MENNPITNDVVLTDILIRIKTIENMLIAAGIINEEEYKQNLKKTVDLICKSIHELPSV